MGNFYSNITLQGPAQPDILAFLRAEVITAFVTPTNAGGSTVIYEQDSDEQDLDTLDSVAAHLSSHFDCPALAALVHDDDVLLLRLHQSGDLFFAYDSQDFSHPGVRHLCRAFQTPSAVFGVWLSLHRPHLTFIFEHLRHGSVLRHLRLPEWAVASGYGYIHRGEAPPGLELEDLRHSRRE